MMKRRIYGVKIKKYLLHIGLLIAVIVSLVFSAIIWIDPAFFHRNTTQTTTTNSSNVNNSDEMHYDLADVYLPTSVILTKDRQQLQLTSDKKDIVGEMNDDAQKLKVAKITSTTARDFESYRNDLLKNNNIMLSYTDPISIGLFNGAVNHPAMFEKYADKTFKHIVLPLDDHKTVYLFNDSNLKIYKVELHKKIPNAVYKVIEGQNIQQTLVQYQEISKNNYILNYTNGVSVPKYSYLINKENTSLFVTHLLGSSNSNSITTKEHDGVTTYTTDNGQRLIVDSNDGMINYSRDARQNYHGDDKGLNQIFKQSFNNLNRLGIVLDDVRFQSYNPENNKVIYESYINGYPIISNKYYGTYEITHQNNGAVQYQFSSDTLQVPLPNDNQTVNLPPTDQVIQALKNNNYNINKVKGIQVGYEWNQNPTSQMVVDLTPTYFVRYNDSWINYKDLGN